MLALVLVLAVLSIACVAVAVWVVVEMRKEKREMERKWRRMYKKGSAAMNSKLDRHMTHLRDSERKKAAELKKALVGIDARVGSLADADKTLGTQVNGVKQRMAMMTREDQQMNRRIADLSEKDQALERDVMGMRPFLDATQVDAEKIQFGRSVSLAKDRQLCIDAQCLSSQDIAQLKAAKPQPPPIGSVWRCNAVKLDNTGPDGEIVPPFPVTFKIVDASYTGAIPSYPLSIVFTEIGVVAEFTPPIPIEADPTNATRFYPYVDIDQRNVAVPQRVFPMAFDGYAVGATCTLNIIGMFTLDVDGSYLQNSPSIFTRIS